MHNIFPIGSISFHIGDADWEIRPWIMTDHGWKLTNGLYYSRAVYPRLWDTLVDRRRGDEVQVPNLSNEGKPFGYAKSTPEFHHNHKFDPSLVVGRTTGWKQDARGVEFSFKLESSEYTKQIKKLADEMYSPIVSAREIRGALGLGLDPKDDPHATDMDLFPDIIAPRGGPKFGSSNNKENNMPTRTLKTPDEIIERKELTVALRLFGQARIQDELYDVIALVQSIGENESIHRVSELKDIDVVGKNVRVYATDASGMCSDFSQDEYSGKYHLVIAGKLEQIVDGFVIVIDDEPEPLGEDALRVVSD